MELPEKIKEAVSSLSKLPGIGEKTAFRMALQISKWRKLEIDQFAHSVKDLASLSFCEDCGFFSESKFCAICLNTHRTESEVLCVVESISDLLAIEKSSQHKGLYHVLGGVLNPLLGIGPDQLKMDKLVERVQRHKVKDLILAINPSVEGDATCSYIKNILPAHLNVQRIGFGVPIGGSLEYLDSLTISKALENRKSF